jgi:hypothetical protein
MIQRQYFHINKTDLLFASKSNIADFQGVLIYLRKLKKSKNVHITIFLFDRVKNLVLIR